MLLNKLCQPILLCMHQHHSGSILVSFFTTATAQLSNLSEVTKKIYNLIFTCSKTDAYEIIDRKQNYFTNYKLNFQLF